MRDAIVRISATAILVSATLAAGLLPVSAQNPTPRSTPNSASINAGTVGVISGGADGTYIRIAADLANVLDGEDLRIIPMIGRGSLQNLRDIMFLRGVDIGIVQMDARASLKAENLHNAAADRLRYITRLYNEEVHILASQSITDIRQLDGKKVNIDKDGSGTNLTARLIFKALGINPEFTTHDQASSYAQLRSGEIDAAVYVAGRPVRAISEFQGDGRFHLLGIPFEGELAEAYFPARFENSDYPRLIEAGQPVDTLAVGSILAVFNWPEKTERYKKVERFVNEFFSRFEEFQQPGRHKKWQEVNLAAEVPGWERLKVAQKWLDQHAAKPARAAASDAPSSEPRWASGAAAQRERMFNEFLTWQRQQ